MLTIRIRSVMWFTIGIAFTIILVLSFAAWRANAAIGPNESTFVPVTPVRIMDTRDPTNVGLAGPFVSAVPQDLQVTGSIPTTSGNVIVVPTGATGVVLNVTAVSPTANGFISIRPADAPGVPSTSSLNVVSGEILPNAVTVSLPTAGADAGKIEITFDAYGTAGPTTDVLIDVVGYNTREGIATLEARQSRIARGIGTTNLRPSDGEVFATASLTVPPGEKQFVHVTGLASIFGNSTVALTCPGIGSCNVGIEIFDVEAGTVISTGSTAGSFYRFVTDEMAGSLAVDALVAASPGVHTYQLRAKFNAVAPEILFVHGSSVTAQTVALGDAGVAPLVVSESTAVAEGPDPALGG
jgi:hypothetical protein